MPRTRLRWRALAVLGALLSVMIDWPIGFAMPTTSNNSQQRLVTNANPHIRYPCTNCSATSANLNLTNSDRAALSDRGGPSVNSSASGRSEGDPSTNGSSKRSSKPDPAEEVSIMPSTTLSYIERGIISNSNRSIPPERLMRIYNKRKRKKLTVARVTADVLRSMRTHNNHSLSSDVNNLMINDNNNNLNNVSESLISNDNNDNVSSESSNKYNPSVDSTTVMHAILDVAEDVVTSTETIVTPQHLSRTDRSIHQRSFYRPQNSRIRSFNGNTSSGGGNNDTNLDRNERSANLSHIHGPARKIQLFIKNRWIQMMPDGTINGTQDDSSDYTILQRTTVDVGQIKIQGVATCLFLCMDQCGAVYGSKTFTDDCVFNESMEQHHYNTYSSTYNSNSRRTLYLALNRHGDPRKLQIPPTRSLGKLATYTKAMTSTVDEARVEKLIARTFGANRVKHGLRQLCDAGKPLIELTTKVLKTRPKCNLLNNANGQTAAPAASAVVSEKLTRIGSSNSTSSSSSSHSNNNSNNHGNLRKKKKKRRCRPNENEQEHNCQRPGPQALRKRGQNRKCLPTMTPEECAHTKKKGGGGKKNNKGANQKKRKNNNNNSAAGNGRKAKNSAGAIAKSTPTSTMSTLSITHRISSSSRETESTKTSTAGDPATQSIRQQLGVAQSHEEENVSTEDSQQQPWQGSSEMPDGEAGDIEDEDASMSVLSGHAQLVNGDDFLYNDEFDVIDDWFRSTQTQSTIDSLNHTNLV